MTNKKSYQNKTDEELVDSSLSEPSFFALIVERYRGPLLAYIKRLGRISTEDAEDLLQEVFLKAYLNLNSFDSGLKFSSWIYRIAHNETISYFRKLKARPQGYAVDFESIAITRLLADFSLKEEIDNKISHDKIKTVLNELNIEHRDLLILKFFEEKSYQEISDIIKKPLGTVASAMNRAKKSFIILAEKKSIKF